MTIAAAFVPRRFTLPAPEKRLFQVDPLSRLAGAWPLAGKEELDAAREPAVRN
jgi:hypothetical protein